jgi:hypothetical protein
MIAPVRLLLLAAWPLEILAAWLLMTPELPYLAAGVAVHVAACGLFGLSLLVVRDGRRNWAWPLLGWGLSLVMFPVLGMLSMTVAFVLEHVTQSRGPDRLAKLEELADTDEYPEDAVARAQELEVQLLDELEIEPVVDVLREDDPELKRAAIEAITKQRNSGSIRLLIDLLHDPSAEARFFASIGLSKLEDEISRAILAAQRHLAEAPDDPEAPEQLAQLYLDYAVSGFLEGVTRTYYLDLARERFEDALRVSPNPDDAVRRLAQVHLLLGNIAEAAVLLEDLGRKYPSDVDIHLLRMEVIYQFGDFRELCVYAGRTLPGVPAAMDGHELVQWWATAGRSEELVAV